MVLPFLSRRVGHQRAHYLTLTTKAVDARKAGEWGLVDVCAERSGVAVAQHLTRLTKLPKRGIAEYKLFTSGLAGAVTSHRNAAVAANRSIFADPYNAARITRFVEHGVMPWEKLPDHAEPV
jgi:polyketide biosynthesis enoyl-CoA hydratase PksH